MMPELSGIFVGVKWFDYSYLSDKCNALVGQSVISGFGHSSILRFAVHPCVGFRQQIAQFL